MAVSVPRDCPHPPSLPDLRDNLFQDFQRDGTIGEGVRPGARDGPHIRPWPSEAIEFRSGDPRPLIVQTKAGLRRDGQLDGVCCDLRWRVGDRCDMHNTLTILDLNGQHNDTRAISKPRFLTGLGLVVPEVRVVDDQTGRRCWQGHGLWFQDEFVVELRQIGRQFLA